MTMGTTRPGRPRPTVGHRLGRWTLRSPLGAGAFGETWRATRDDGAVAAVKVVRTPPGAELKALARLFHPAIPTLLDAATSAPWFMAQELAPGRALSAVLAHGPPDPGPWLCGLSGLFDALALVHATDLVHADIKPENILWSPRDRVPARLVDFGMTDATGGTPLWSAPERLAGGPPTSAADVYALALVAWAGCYGARPFAHLDDGEAMARRARSAPVPPDDDTPRWLAELLVRCLDPAPTARPTAALVADTFLAHGISVPPMDGTLLRRRAHALRIPHRGVDSAVAAWLRRPGQLVVVGPLGCGRRHLADQVTLDLAADGRRFIRIAGGEGPWGAIETTLRSAGHTLPTAPDNDTRVDRVADLLADDTAVLVVRDYDVLDTWSQRVVDRLATGNTAVFLSAATRPGWARSAVHLEPLDGNQLGTVLRSMLGATADRPETRRAVWRTTRGMAGDVVRYVVACVEHGALVQRHGSWVLEETRLPELPERTGAGPEPAPGSVARAVARTLALLRRPVSPEGLSSMLDAPAEAVEQAVSALTASGRAQLVGGEVVVQPALARTLRDAGPLPFVPARARGWVARTHPDDPDVLAWLALAEQDRAQIEAVGTHAVTWWMARNPARADTLSAAIWEQCATWPVLHVRMQALVAVGAVDAARDLGVAALTDRTPGPEGVGPMVVMAELANNHAGAPNEALAWCGKARTAANGTVPPALVLAEAKAHSLLGDHQKVRAVLLPWSSAAPPESADALAAWLRARTLIAQSTHQLGNIPDAIDLLAGIPAELGAGLPDRAVAWAALGRLYWFAGQFHAADAAMARAGESDGGLGMLDRARLLNNLGAVRHHSGNRAEAVAAWEQALVLFERVRAQVEANRTQANLCVGYKELGRWERARQAGVAAARGAAKIGAPDLRCHAALNLGELHLCQDRLDDAEVCFFEALRYAGTAQMDREQVEARLRLLELSVLRGEGGLSERASEVQRTAEAAGMVVEYCQASALAAVAAAREKASVVLVDPLIEAALRPLQKAGAAADLAWVRLWVAEAHLAVGRAKEAAIEVDRARAFARERGNVPLLRRAEVLDQRLSSAWKDPSRDHRLEQLVAVAVAINEQADLSAIFEHIARAGRTLLDADRSFVLTGDPPRVVAAEARGLAHGRPSMSVVEKAIRERREVIAADVDERGDLRAVRSVAAMELRSVMCVPMQHSGEVIGAIYVDSRSASQKRLWDSAELLRGLAAMAAVAVVKMRYFEETVRQATIAAQLAERERTAQQLAAKNAELERLNQQLRASAITDPLTGIGNRRHMATVLSSAFAEARSGGPQLSVIIADIDHFKRINDTWGHQTGDAVIAEVAHRIRAALRGEDRVFRYGGEELVVLTRAVEPEVLRGLCERLRGGIADVPMHLGDDRTGRVTASFGASSMCLRADTRWEEILQRADAALYEAKAAGRDRVVLHGDTGREEADDAVA